MIRYFIDQEVNQKLAHFLHSSSNKQQQAISDMMTKQVFGDN
ncbi:hypothetical protein NRF22_08295 [Oenococcus kitaharae]|nr:hypothetical protein [Oenococcus kitaharae]MCV3297115.1 hypothetical protein [Oenococcus kitaharae]